jgi:hypothetical protein
MIRRTRTHTYGSAIHIGRSLILIRDGFSLETRSVDIEYWTPWAYKPLSIRSGYRGRHGWWGALAIQRQDPS